MSEIVQKGDRVLRKVALEVPLEEIRSQKIDTIIRRMIKALDKEEDGVAIAAPQIGESLRIFVVSKRVFDLIAEEKSRSKSKRENLDEFAKDKPEYKDLVFINPTIIKTSKRKEPVEEGCLSVRWLYGKVERPIKTLVKAYDEQGRIFTFGGSGILSQIFQHEIDHLNGILFVDKASDLKEIPPQKEI
jgi:peptide deformylase